MAAAKPMSPVHSAITRYGSSSRCRIASAWPVSSSSASYDVLGMHDLHQLDLVELVLADHAARVLAVAARLRAEARRVRGQLERQRVGGEDLVAHDVGQRDLRGRDQVERLAVAVLRRPCVTENMSASNFGSCVVPTSVSRVDHVRRVALGVAVLARVHVEHELRERAMQAREIAAQERRSARRRASPRSRNRAAPSAFADVDVVRAREIERARRAPAAHLDVVVGRPARRASTGAGGSAARAGNRAASPARARARASSALQLVADAGDFAPSARDVSSPLPFATPICLDSALRFACSSCVRVWIVLRSRFERLEARRCRA